MRFAGIGSDLHAMLKLALRSLFRHKARTAITLGAIIVSVAGLILAGGFVQDIFDQLGESIIHSQSGHLQIAKEGYFTEGSRRPDRYFIEDPDQVRQRVAALPGVVEAMIRLSFSGLVSNGHADLPIVGEGVEPGPESRLGTSLRLTAGEQLSGDNSYGILIGNGVARALKLKPGDSVTLTASTTAGAMNSLDFRVAGIFETYSRDYDARTVKVPLRAAQQLLDASVANTVVVELRRTSDTVPAEARIEHAVSDRGLEVKPWQSLNDFYEKTVKLYDRQLGVLRLIVLLMVLLAVANTINMAVHERTGEMGTMRALGTRERSLFIMVMAEGLILGLIGSVAGAILGVTLAKVISAIGIPMPPPPNADLGYTARVRIDPAGVTWSFVVGIVATTAASYLPARRVLRVPVVDALRANV